MKRPLNQASVQRVQRRRTATRPVSNLFSTIAGRTGSHLVCFDETWWTWVCGWADGPYGKNLYMLLAWLFVEAVSVPVSLARDMGW
jgi:hypothetical protein